MTSQRRKKGYPQAEMAAICPMMSIQAKMKAGNSPRSVKRAPTGCPPLRPGRVINSDRHKPEKQKQIEQSFKSTV